MGSHDQQPATCPHCEAGEMRPAGPSLFRCGACKRVLSGGFLNTLLRIRSLPDALGRHACECGHPEMRPLPDGVYLCPACRAEVVPHVRR